MENKTRVKNISILGAFALSIGTALGWGSFVVTGSSFVSQAGPVGSIIGLLIGMLIMMVVAYNYHYMMNKYPDTNGGIYSFAKYTIGSDHAFLVSWFLIITYLAILWANVSSFSLFAQYIFGSTFQFGFHYVIWGYDIWLGEILLSAFFLFLFAGICLLKKQITTHLQFGLAALFIAIIIGGFIAVSVMHEGGFKAYEPAFGPSNDYELVKIARVISMTPWAFIGFESISHSSRNFKFKKKHVFKIFFISLAVSALIYILMCQISISAFPERFTGGWSEYLTADSKTLVDIEKAPPLFVIKYYLGDFGIALFAIALFAIISTSIIGNIYALSGLISTMARNGVLPKKLETNDKNDNHTNAIIFITLVSFVMLFFGRVLIGWIVDVNNICGTIVFTYVGVVTIYQARKDQKKFAKATGIIGLVTGIAFAVYIIISSVISVEWIESESILVFFIWAILGFGYYTLLLARDKKKVFGHSMAPTFGMYAIIICSIGSWLAQVVQRYNDMKMTVIGIILCVIIAILSQVFFFAIYGIAIKREKATHDQFVLGMATLVEGRDNSTGSHIKRTSKVVELIVNEMVKDPSMSFDNRFAKCVIKAAPMHDLGKIAVDDIILRKPGKFTPEEYEIMKKHSGEGAKIVKEVLGESSDEYFERIVVNVAHYHHERWDGSGYPCGLKGEEIPLEARIMAIADVYDALVSRRVYKDEFSFEDANKILLEGMGTQFDPSLEKYYLAAKSKIEAFYIKQKENEKESR